MKNYLETIMNFVVCLLFGVRVEGEPVDLSYPEPTEDLPPLDERFFDWCKQLNVGCQAKSKPVFYG